MTFIKNQSLVDNEQEQKHDETYFSSEKDKERAGRLWTRPEFSSREMDVKFAKAIANEIWTARQSEYQEGFSHGREESVEFIKMIGNARQELTELERQMELLLKASKKMRDAGAAILRDIFENDKGYCASESLLEKYQGFGAEMDEAIKECEGDK